ncbi:MAG: ATP-binding protein [Phycisphaerales bacterium]
MTTAVNRPFWLRRFELAWKRAPIVWLTGVRRAGKTTLVRQLPGTRYLNCDLPSTSALLADPEAFFRSLRERVVVLDEIHQLADPSRMLKIAADEFPQLRVVATGSSTLAATSKFRDSLTGRKRAVHLVPVLAAELSAFGVEDMRHRLLRGGLPGNLLPERLDPSSFAEWLDSYFSRDVQELFRVDKRGGFLLLLEVLLRQNGGFLNVSNLADASRLSRPTVTSYVDVFAATHTVHIVRPYHGGGTQELVRQPRVYGFDTGFVCHARGWDALRTEDLGGLWENVVLEHLVAQPAEITIHYWRDKSEREIDFVVPRQRGACDAIECKWDPRRFDSSNLTAFRSLYPKGRNFVVAPSIREPYTRTLDGFDITFTGLTAGGDGSLAYE